MPESMKGGKGDQVYHGNAGFEKAHHPVKITLSFCESI